MVDTIQKDLLGGIIKEKEIKPIINIEVYWSYKDIQEWVDDNPNHPTSKKIAELTRLDINELMKEGDYEAWSDAWEKRKDEILAYIAKAFGWKDPTKWYTSRYKVQTYRGESKTAQRRMKKDKTFADVEDAHKETIKLMKKIWKEFEPRDDYYFEIQSLMPRLSRTITIRKDAAILASKYGPKREIPVAELLLTAEQNVRAREGKWIGRRDITNAMNEIEEERKK